MEVAGKLLSTVKRKAAELQSGAMMGRGHSELSMAIYSQKHETQALSHLAEHDVRVSRALKEWASNEQNVCLGAVYVKLAELSQIQAQIINNLMTEHNRRRKVFKDMLRREKELDEFNKDVESQRAKVTKLTKQLTQCRAARKVDILKVETLQVDLDKAKEIERESTENLNKELENHEQFKFEQIKDTLWFTAEAGRRYHTESLQVLDVEEQLRQLFLPDSFSSCTEDMATAAQIEAANLVNGLAESLNLSKPTSMLEKNSTLEQLIKSDRMLNDDPRYVGAPEQEVADVEAIRRPLPPPPIADLYSQPLPLPAADSDDSEDDYTQPYEFLTGVGTDGPPGCRPAPTRKPPNPPGTSDTDYLEMYHNQSGEPERDGILPKSIDIDKDDYLVPTGSGVPPRPSPPSTTMPAQTPHTSTFRKIPTTLPDLTPATSQPENTPTMTPTSPIAPLSTTPTSTTPTSATPPSTTPPSTTPASPKAHPVPSPRISVGQHPKSPKPPLVKPKPPGLLPKPVPGKPEVKTRPDVRPRPTSKPVS